MAQRYVERQLSRGGKIYTATDGRGSFEAYRPAQHVKPQAKGLIKRILGAFQRAFKRVDPKDTTEQGSASAASPSTYGFTLLAGRYERRGMIADCREMIENDPRARRSTLKFAREAARGGVSIILNKDSNSGLSEATLKIAQESVDRVQLICNRRKVVSWGWMLLVEGDVFVQWIVNGNRVIGGKRMPAASMERLSDDTDEFINPQEAFSQLDTVTQATVATFPEALIAHSRWCHIDGERYGQSEVASGRRIRKLLELQEEAQAVRRFARASNPTLYNVGDENTPGTPDEVKAFRDENGMIEGRHELYDPQNVARIIVANGNVTQDATPGDSNVSDVDDLKYMQNLFTNAALPTPSALYNLDAESVNRDVLTDVRAEFLKETRELSDCVGDIVRSGLELDLLLHNILPETVHVDIHFSESDIETPTERTNRLLSLRKNATADFRPDPLVTKRKLVQMLKEDLDITDMDAYIEELAEEMQATFERNLDEQKQQAELQMKLAPPEQGVPSTPPTRNGNGNGRKAPGADSRQVYDTRPLVKNGTH